MSKYRSKQQAEQNPSKGEENYSPSLTIEGEYMEMKDILNAALKGTQFEKKEVQYFAPDDVTKINHMFRNNLDLTDLDQLRQQADYFKSEVQKAYEKQQTQQQPEQQSEQKPEPKPEPQPKTTE